MEIERPLDQIVGLGKPFHSLRSVWSGDDHLVTASNSIAADFAPHLLAFSLEDPQHVIDGIGRSPTNLQSRDTCVRVLSRFLLVA